MPQAACLWLHGAANQQHCPASKFYKLANKPISVAQPYCAHYSKRRVLHIQQGDTVLMHMQRPAASPSRQEQASMLQSVYSASNERQVRQQGHLTACSASQPTLFLAGDAQSCCPCMASRPASPAPSCIWPFAIDCASTSP